MAKKKKPYHGSREHYEKAHEYLQIAEHLAAEWHEDQQYGDQPYLSHLKRVRDVLAMHGYDQPSPDDGYKVFYTSPDQGSYPDPKAHYDLRVHALLHDAIEDIPNGPGSDDDVAARMVTIGESFGLTTCMLIACVSGGDAQAFSEGVHDAIENQKKLRHDPDAPRAERVEAFYDSLRALHQHQKPYKAHLAAVLKSADRYANVEAAWHYKRPQILTMYAKEHERFRFEILAAGGDPAFFNGSADPAFGCGLDRWLSAWAVRASGLATLWAENSKPYHEWRLVEDPECDAAYAKILAGEHKPGWMLPAYKTATKTPLVMKKPTITKGTKDIVTGKIVFTDL